MRERIGAPPDARALLHLGIVHVIRRNFEEAERLHLEGLAMAEASGDLYSVACNLHMLAHVAAEQGQFDKAEHHYHSSIAVFRRSQDRWGLALALGNLGHLLTELSRVEAAEACYHESLAYGREIGSSGELAFTLMS